MPQDIPSDDYDARLDALEQQTRSLQSSLQRMSVPFWKRWRFLGSLVGVLLVAGGWVWSAIQKDPEIPRMLHSNILMSDKALALTIKRGIAGDGSVSPLVQQIGAKVGHHLKTDDEARSYLFEVAKSTGVRTWSEARLFKRQPVPVGSLRCQLLADPQLWDLVVGTAPGAPRAREISQSCTEGVGGPGQALQGPRSVAHFADFSPMVLPFQARAGDAVELDIRILAQRHIEDGTLVEISNAHDFVEATLYPANAIAFDPPVRSNRLTQLVEVPEGEEARVLAITLSEEGQSKVQGPDGAGDFFIYLFATVTVIPEPRL